MSESTISGSREGSNGWARQGLDRVAVFRAAISTVRPGLGPGPELTDAIHSPPAPSPEEFPRTRAWKHPAVSLPSIPDKGRSRALLRVARTPGSATSTRARSRTSEPLFLEVSRRNVVLMSFREARLGMVFQTSETLCLDARYLEVSDMVVDKAASLLPFTL